MFKKEQPQPWRDQDRGEVGDVAEGALLEGGAPWWAKYSPKELQLMGKRHQSMDILETL